MNQQNGLKILQMLCVMLMIVFGDFTGHAAPQQTNDLSPYMTETSQFSYQSEDPFFDWLGMEKPKPPPALGYCPFYQDFINLIKIEPGTAIEAWVRALSMEDAKVFMRGYEERLESTRPSEGEAIFLIRTYRSQLRPQSCRA